MSYYTKEMTDDIIDHTNPLAFKIATIVMLLVSFACLCGLPALLFFYH